MLKQRNESSFKRFKETFSNYKQTICNNIFITYKPVKINFLKKKKVKKLSVKKTNYCFTEHISEFDQNTALRRFLTTQTDLSASNYHCSVFSGYFWQNLKVHHSCHLKSVKLTKQNLFITTNLAQYLL